MGRKGLLVVVATVLVVAAVIFITQSFGGKKISGPVCEQVLAYIKEGDAESSYALFSEIGRSTLTAEKWQDQVGGLRIAYANGSFKLQASDDATPLGDTIAQTRNNYTLESGGSAYEINCFVSNEEINAFTSRPVN